MSVDVADLAAGTLLIAELSIQTGPSPVSFISIIDIDNVLIPQTKFHCAGGYFSTLQQVYLTGSIVLASNAGCAYWYSLSARWSYPHATKSAPWSLGCLMELFLICTPNPRTLGVRSKQPSLVKRSWLQFLGKVEVLLIRPLLDYLSLVIEFIVLPKPEPC